MASTIPRITTRPADGGWLNSCPACGWEAWHFRRPAADRTAHEHLRAHAKAVTR